MALESVITRLKAALAEELAGYTLTDEKKWSLLRAVLDYELPEHRAAMLVTTELTLSFRRLDAGGFRLLSNATLDDALRLTLAGTAAVAETIAFDFRSLQLIEGVLSHDSESGATVTADLCVDADPADASAGSFLAADEGVTVTWDAVQALDKYPTEYVVLRLTLAGSSTGGVRSVRVRLTGLNKSALGLQVRAAGQFAAARFFKEMLNAAMKGGDPLTQQNLMKRIVGLERAAKGMLGFASDGGAATGKVRGAAVNAGGGVENPYWGRLKG